MIEELTILREQRPENVIEEIDSIEILPFEREPLTYQLIDELFSRFYSGDGVEYNSIQKQTTN